jgi:hypothetical protein
VGHEKGNILSHIPCVFGLNSQIWRGGNEIRNPKFEKKKATG